MSDNLQVRTMQEVLAEGKKADILFWVGCAGSFDGRAQKVTKAMVKILNHLSIDFAVLGNEENCTGDPARRAGNEFIFQMLAQNNVATLNGYEVKKIITACPHCFNVLKNEYPALGGIYEVMHHSSFLQQLINEGRLTVKNNGKFKGRRITFHDSCYLGRANNIYEAPRELLSALDAELVEMNASKSNGMCCGAGGAQMWKEDEAGDERINMKRVEQALETNAETIAVSCPFCNTMLTDGVKAKESEASVQDIAEIIAEAQDLI